MKTMLSVLTVIQLTFVNSIFAQDQKNQSVPDLAVAKQYVKAVQEIEKIRNGKTPDWAAINTQYELSLPVIKYIDAKCATHYAEELSNALKKCASGDKVEINGQIVGKGFQHVTVLAIRQELDLMEKASPADKKICADKIAAYFEVIRPTFIRRDKGFFGGKKTLEAGANAALEKLKADKGDLLMASRELEDVIARTYALSMLYELEEIQKLRDSDVATCDVKRVEASMFYRIIRPRIEKRSPKTNETILNTLQGSFGAINAQAIEKELSTGLGIKLR